MSTESTSVRGVFLETTSLFALRAIFFFACRHYVSLSLSQEIRSVIEEGDAAGEASGSGAASGNSDSFDLDDPSSSGSGSNAIDLESMERGDAGYYDNTPPSGAAGKGKARGGTGNEPDSDSMSSASKGAAAALRRASPLRQSRTSVLYSKLATSVFCCAFAECGMLFTLVLFGEVLSDRARTLNWSMSLLALLFLIIFFIPFGICFLLTHRNRQSDVSKTIGFTLVPFGLYLFLYYKVGSFIASKVVVDSDHSLGLINSLLSRICVPGVILIASLSGAGAVNTAWEAFEWRSISSAEPVTDAQILAAERSLYRARMDISQRTRSLHTATSSAAREAATSAAQSIFSRWTSSSPAAAHLASLETELKALNSIEGQMMIDVALLKKRKEMREMGRSFRGRLWLAAGWALSVYCVWRVFVSCINLVFGYSQRQPRSPTMPPVDDGTTHTGGTDLITSLLGRLALLLNMDIDIAVWSRLIGLLLIGSIILANMRNVLASVSRIFKATSSGISTSFMLLFLAELMSIYLLTSLISLPTSASESSTTLLSTLPAFNVFSRLFDSVFLLAAAAVMGIRFLNKKIGQEDNVGSQF